MDTAVESTLSMEKFWARRAHHEPGTTEYLLDHLFPPAQVEDEISDKITHPPTFCAPCSNKYQQEDKQKCECTESSIQEFRGESLGDVPCTYRVPRLEPEEMAAVGVYIDPRIIPGFRYRIRTISQERSKKRWLFGGEALEIESIGRGYSRRVTLVPSKGNLNSNPDHFWTDSNPLGFAFQIQVTSPGDKFTIFDTAHLPVGHLELLENRGSQVEIAQKVLKDGAIEKTVRIRAMCKVDWFHEENNNAHIPLNGVAISLKTRSGVSTKIVDARLSTHPRRGFTLTPGVSSSLRSLKVNSPDIPTSYTIVGLEPYQFPVIGTYVDERIVPGFYYKVTVGGGGRSLWSQRALRLDSIGRGYAKRLTFAPDRLNSPENHLWSDSHLEGVVFQHSAVRPGMRFRVATGDLTVGTATVFRDDCGPQVELHHSLEEEEGEVHVVKRIQVDVKCEVALDVGSKDEELVPHAMRVSGVAVLSKSPKQKEAVIMRIEDIGLDSQLNILIVNQWKELTFYPLF